MKKIVLPLLVVPLLALVLSGCATYMPAGAIYVGAKGAIATTDNISYSKIGKATATSILGLVATGDSSIKTAVANGGITKIKYVDYEVENILGIYGKYTTVVYGD
jgi:uncharacterized protein YceK